MCIRDRCTCARRLIVIETKSAKPYLELLQKSIDQIQIGPYTKKPEPFMGPVISKEAFHALLSAQENLISKGAIPLALMKKQNPPFPFLSPGLLDVTAVKERKDKEYFGPLLQVIRVPDLDSAIQEANKTEYGLSASILTADAQEFQECFTRLRAGIINWNTPTTGALSSAPFGGIGKSGNYRPGAYYAADYCAYPVVSMETDHLQLPDTLLPGLLF